MAKGSSRQFGKYRLIAHLATGGMADIYLASQVSMAGFEKLIVIKRILPNLAREERFVQMFLDEARIAAMLNHPNVVQIFDLGRVDNQFFIAMEYLAGESLSMLIKTCRRKNVVFPHNLAASMVLQAAEGLHHAHTMKGKDGKPLNIVHRDVSPQNIFVLYDGAVKVVDFGIAKAALRSTHTRTGTLKGKYAYMSPEQVMSTELDGRSDVYSLGIVLWECLTGRKLYRQESDLLLLRAITEEDAPSPQTINPNVPPAIAEITMRALARKKEERYQSAAEFRNALSGYLKTLRVDSDTMVIGQFMRAVFKDRIEEKDKLIEGARSADMSLEAVLFGDLSQYASDTEVSVPRSTPGTAYRPGYGPVPTRRRRGLILFLALLFTAGGAGAAYFAWKYLRGEPVRDAADAGAIAVAGPPDAGTAGPADAPVVEAVVDAGVTPPDAGQQVAVADTRKPPKDVRGPRRKKRRRRKVGRSGEGKDPVKVAAKDPKDVPDKKPDDPPGPPGKLRLITNPWTDIYYQGKKIGQTPLVDVELPAGMIKLRAVNKEAGIDRVIVVKIKPGERNVHRQNFF